MIQASRSKAQSCEDSDINVPAATSTFFSTNVAAVATIPGSTAATVFAATVLTSAAALTNLAKKS